VTYAPDLGQHLRLEVLGEGIESEAQLAVVCACGCRFGQGHLLGRPLPQGDLIQAFPEGQSR
jgi:diguanylate cyclase